MWFWLLMSLFSSPNDSILGIPRDIRTIPVTDAASPATPPHYDAPPMDPLAQRAADALYNLVISDDNSRYEAARALIDMGPGALPLLLSALRSGDARVRDAAGRAMTLIVPEDKDKGPILAVAAKQDVLIVRLFAVMALGSIADAYDQSANTLVDALEDPSEQVRLCAITRLLNVRYRPDDATLQKLIAQEKNAEIRKAATELQALPPSNKFFPVRRMHRGGDDVIHRPPPASPLYTAPDAAKIEQDMRQLKKRDPAAKMAAAQELASFGPNAEAAVPRLIKLLRDPDHLVRAHAAMALRHVGARP